VISAAAGLATSTIASAAADALKTLNAAAAVSAKIVSDTASKALAEFPRLQEDIREIRSAQQTESSTTVSMVRDLLQAHASGEEVRLESIEATGKAIESHMIRQNGRLDKAEIHITRQNMAIFGVAGPVALIILGVIGRQLITIILEAEKQGTLMNLPNIVMGVTTIIAILAGLVGYFGYKIYKLLTQHAASNVITKE
jgi:hypothetical protein